MSKNVNIHCLRIKKKRKCKNSVIQILVVDCSMYVCCNFVSVLALWNLRPQKWKLRICVTSREVWRATVLNKVKFRQGYSISFILPSEWYHSAVPKYSYLIFIYENRDLLRRSLFSWTLGFGLVRLYQLEFSLWHRKSHISCYVKIQTIRLKKTKNRFGLQLWFGMTLFPLLKHLYLGQEYIWLGFWEL